jgi:hypothetical protein
MCLYVCVEGLEFEVTLQESMHDFTYTMSTTDTNITVFTVSTGYGSTCTEG